MRSCFLARLDTSPDADGAMVCGGCGDPIERAGGTLRHVGETTRQSVVPAKEDRPAVRDTEAVIERTLDELAHTWTPSTTNADRAEVIAANLYAEGLIPRRRRPAPRRRGAGSPRRRDGVTGDVARAADVMEKQLS